MAFQSISLNCMENIIIINIILILDRLDILQLSLESTLSIVLGMDLLIFIVMQLLKRNIHNILSLDRKFLHYIQMISLKALLDSLRHLLRIFNIEHIICRVVLLQFRSRLIVLESKFQNFRLNMRLIICKI